MNAQPGFWTYLPFAPFFGFGFAMLGYGAWSAWRSIQAMSWPATTGELKEATLRLHPGREKSDSPSYEVVVQYSYTIDGKTYAGSRIAFGYVRSSLKARHEEIHRHLKGAKAVVVRYHPSKLAMSCLSCGLHRSLLSVFVFALYWLAFVSSFTLLIWLGSRVGGFHPALAFITWFLVNLVVGISVERFLSQSDDELLQNLVVR